MSGWTLVDTDSTRARGRTFQRALGVSELGFLWDSLLDGTADTVQHLELRLVNGARDAHLFSADNIVRAWSSTKRRYPLAGAAIRGADVTFGDTIGASGFASEPCFVIREHNLTVLRPDEIVFGQVTCAEEVQQRVAAILNGHRPLSSELLVKLYVFYPTGSENGEVIHLLALTAHCVTDGAANSTFIRCLVDTLARGGHSAFEPPQMPLEDRLAMAIPSEIIEPLHLRLMSPAKRRWRRAAGAVIFQLMMARRQGGHTLPRRLAWSRPYAPARSGQVSISLTTPETTRVMASCRSYNITFGNAYTALAQVAMTRVLYRRYLRGDISEQEWEHRQRQPYITSGPLNLRPYLDDAWLGKGGGGEFMLSIGFFYHTLPFMTLGETAERYRPGQHPQCVVLDGAPPFSELLTFDRFLHRAGLVKKWAKAFFSHPLFHEIVRAGNLACTERTRLITLRWMKHIETVGRNDTPQSSDRGDADVAITDAPVVSAHGGSSLGSTDLVSPIEYPLPSTHPLSPCSPVAHPLRAGYVTPPASDVVTEPTVLVESAKTYLHTRPGELYLGTASSRGRLNMYVMYDGHVFEDAVVQEWLDEVKQAVLWYLGRGVEQHSTSGDTKVMRGEGLLAKL